MREEIEKFMNELEDINEAFDGLIEKGYLEVVGLNDDGQPLYSLTEKGKMLGAILDETEEN